MRAVVKFKVAVFWLLTVIKRLNGKYFGCYSLKQVLESFASVMSLLSGTVDLAMQHGIY